MSGVFQAAVTMVGSPRVSLPTTTNVTHSQTGGATAGIRVDNVGVYSRREGGVFTPIQNWVTPTVFAPGTYEVMFTVLSGTVNTAGSDATGSWLALTSTRNWGRTQGSLSATVTGTLQIRLGVTVLASSSVTLVADAT